MHIKIILHCRYNLKAYCYEFDEKYITWHNSPHTLYLHQFFTNLDEVNCAGVPQISKVYSHEGSIVLRSGSWWKMGSYMNFRLTCILLFLFLSSSSLQNDIDVDLEKKGGRKQKQEQKHNKRI